MHSAAKENNLEEVTRLLATDVDVNGRDNLNRTALHLAAWRGNAEIIQALIKAKADVLAVAQDGYGALHFAVNSGSLPAVEALLCKSVNAQLRLKLIKNKRTALHLAAAKNNLDIVQYLINHGADPLSLTKSGETPSDLAVDTAVIDVIVAKCQQSVEQKKKDLQDLGNRPVASIRDPIATPPVALPAAPAIASSENSAVPLTSAAGAEIKDSNDVAIEIKPLKRKMKPLYAPPKIKLGHLGDDDEEE